MRLAHLSLADFRSYPALELPLEEGHHLFLGENGAGKTNLLEAIHVLGVGSSMRASRDATLVRHGARGYRAGGRFLDARQPDRPALRAEVVVELTGGDATAAATKRFFLDKAPARASDLLAAIKVVAFAPADQELVQGSGSVRRRYLDATGCQLSGEYMQLLREYQRALRQRNETLSRTYVYEHGRSRAAEAREPWTDLLVEVGAELTRRRRALVAQISACVERHSAESTRDAGLLSVEYVPGLPDGDAAQGDIAASLRAGLQRAAPRDEAVGYTTTGPHTDDLRLLLRERDLRRFGSLGQQQLSAMYLKLAQAELVRTVAGADPILLVDEMFAILDRRAAEEFLGRVETGGQIFLATAQEGWLGELRDRRFRVHRVRNGAVAAE